MKIGTVVRKYPSWLSEIHPVQCCKRHRPMPTTLPQNIPFIMTNDERITNIFCRARFPMPSAFSVPIIDVRSSRMISRAAIMLNSATSSITVMMTPALTLCASSQSKIIGKRSRMLMTRNESCSSPVRLSKTTW